VGEAQALAEIKRLVELDRVLYTHHAQVRMIERGARRRDVEHALFGANRATEQPDRGCWRVTGGVDLDGDDLTVVVALEADVVVVTLF
jgi:hypothetical protein